MNAQLRTSAATATRVAPGRRVGKDNTVSVVEAALRLARRGIVVFPCGENKRPLTKHGFKDATTDEAQIRLWWNQWRKAFVGVPTGAVNNLLVFDVDPGGLDFWLRHDELDSGRRHTTRRGYHFLFRAPPGAPIRNSAGRVAQGVDVRGEGGYIIWWPATGLATSGPEIEKLPAVPTQLLELVRNEEPGNGTPQRVPTPEIAGDEESIPVGKRNDFLTREAGKLRRVNSDPVTISVAMHALNQRRCSPPLEGKEVDQIVKSVLRYAPHESIADTTARSFTVISDHQFAEREPLSWHVKGVIPKAELVVIYGASGSGKSFFAFDLVSSVATGTSWQDRSTKKGRVVYIVAEGATGFLNRLKAFAKTHDGNFPGVSIVADAPNLLGEQDHVSLAQQIEATGGADLIVVDTLAACSAGADENAAKDMGRVIEHCKRLHNATGATVVLVHHSGKDEGKGARGWSGLRAAADAEIEISKNGDQRVATITKMKDGEDGVKFAFKLLPVEIGVDSDNEPVRSCTVEPVEVVPNGHRKEPSPGSKERTLLDAIRNVPSIDGWEITASIIEVVASELPKPVGRDTRKQHLARAFQALASKGFIIVEGEKCRAV